MNCFYSSLLSFFFLVLSNAANTQALPPITVSATCEQVTLTRPSYTGSPAQYYWQTSANGTSLAHGGITYVITTPGTYTIYMRALYQGEWYTQGSETVSVHTPLNAGTLNSNISPTCQGENVTLGGTPASGGTGNYQYSWQKYVSGGWQNISGASSASYIETNNQGLQYRRKVTSGICGTKYSNVIEVPLNNLPPSTGFSPGAINGTQDVCYNTPAHTLGNSSSASWTGQPASSISYQWQASTNNSSWNNISGATGLTHNPGSLTSTRWYRRRATTLGCSYVKYTSSVKVTVINSGEPTPVLDHITPGCGRATISLIDPPGYNLMAFWQTEPSGTWMSQTGDNAGFNKNYRANGTYYARLHNSDNLCWGPPLTVNLTQVTPDDLDPGEISAETERTCFEGSFTISGTPASGGTGSYSYQWQEYLYLTGWTDISGATGPSHTVGSNYMREYRRKVTSGVCPSEYSNVIQVPVAPPPVALDPGSINGTKTICGNTSAGTLGNVASADWEGEPASALVYQWQVSTNNSSWTDIENATGLTYSPGNLAATRWYRRKVTTLGCVYTKFTPSVKITVVNVPQPTLSTILPGCGTARIIITDPNPPANTDVMAFWQTEPTGTWRSPTGDNAGFPREVDSNGTYYVRLYHLFDHCWGPALTVNVTQVEGDIIPGIISSNMDRTCFEGSFTMTGTSPSGGNGSYSYQWQEYLFMSGWTDIAGATSSSHTVGSNYLREYRRKVSSGSCPPQYSNVVQTLVYPPVEGLDPGTITGAQETCHSALPGMLGNGDSARWDDLPPSYLNYQWQSSTDSLSWTDITGETGLTYTPTTGLTSTTWYRRKVTTTLCGLTNYTPPLKVLLRPEFSMLFRESDVLGQNRNLVIELTPKIPMTAIGTTSYDVRDVSVNLQYYDEFGRTEQVQQVGASPIGSAMIMAFEYDNFGREARSYLPYEVCNTTGRFQEEWKVEQREFYNNPNDNVANDPSPFSEVLYELGSSRIQKAGAVGDSWQLGTGWEIKVQHQANATDEIIRWEIDSEGLPQSLGFYPADSLDKEVSIDEHDVSSSVFLDHLGRAVASSAQLEGTGNYAYTYNIYDHMNRLRFTLPPEAVARLGAEYNGQFSTIKRQFLDKWATQYIHDAKGRVIHQKIPGKDWEYFVYDSYDRLVLSQNGQLRKNGKWQFTKFDTRNRGVISGHYTSTLTRDELDALAKSASARYETYTGSTSFFGYSNDVFPTSNIEVHQVSYFDDYVFLDDLNLPVGLDYDPSHEGHLPSSSSAAVHMLPTGSATRILNSSTFLYQVTYYDQKYRPIQGIQQNHLGGYEVTSSEFDFSGNILSTKTTHTGVETLTRKTTNALDHNFRLLSQTLQVNSEAPVEMVSVDYNKLGQVIEKNLHLSGGEYLQSMDYRYNIRGWLTHINNSSLSVETGINDDMNDYFGMELGYEQNVGTGAQVLFNGGISAMKWNAGDGEKAYNYTYDPLNQLKTASHYKKTAGWATAQEYSVDHLAYDLNGNILSVRRRDHQGNSLDSLAMNYVGNRLTRVRDDGDVNHGFVDGNTVGDDFAYDEDGNLILDKNKGIDSITYNHLNLPEAYFLNTGEKIVYQYTAGGTKLSREHWNGTTLNLKYDYAGGIVFINNGLDHFFHAHGRVLKDDGGNFDYQYHLTDHLGNTRVTLSSETSVQILQATMENEQAVTEETAFVNLASTRVQTIPAIDHTGSGDTPDVVRLNGFHGVTQGPATTLQVMPGDEVTMEVYVKYLDRRTTDNSLAAAMVLSGLMGAPGYTIAEEGATSYLLTHTTTGATALLPADNTGDAPQAYLNYILMDEAHNPVQQGFQKVSTAAAIDPVNPAGNHERLLITLEIEQPGYLYVDLTHNSAEDIDVYFDDLTVTQYEGPVIQVNEYYPFGMEALTWTREGARINPHRFNGGNELITSLDIYETILRGYDPAIGRFNAIDVAAGKYVGWTPYQYGFNNPVYWNDPLGNDPPCRQCPTDENNPPDDPTWRQSQDAHDWNNGFVDGGTPFGRWFNSRVWDFYSNPFGGYVMGSGEMVWSKAEYYGKYNSTPHVYNSYVNEWVPAQEIVDWDPTHQNKEYRKLAQEALLNNEFDLFNAAASQVSIWGAAMSITANGVRPKYTGLNDWKATKSMAKKVGRRFSGASLAFTAYDIYDQGVNLSTTLDALAAGAAFVPGAGWMISGGYFLTNLLWQGVTGQTIGESIQEAITGDGTQAWKPWD